MFADSGIRKSNDWWLNRLRILSLLYGKSLIPGPGTSTCRRCGFKKKKKKKSFKTEKVGRMEAKKILFKIKKVKMTT